MTWAIRPAGLARPTRRRRRLSRRGVCGRRGGGGAGGRGGDPRGASQGSRRAGARRPDRPPSRSGEPDDHVAFDPETRFDILRTLATVIDVHRRIGAIEAGPAVNENVDAPVGGEAMFQRVEEIGPVARDDDEVPHGDGVTAWRARRGSRDCRGSGCRYARRPVPVASHGSRRRSRLPPSEPSARRWRESQAPAWARPRPRPRR